MIATLSIPSAIALFIKAVLFLSARGKLFKKNMPLALFLVALFLLNLAEFLLFTYVNQGTEDILPVLMKSYYVAAVFAAATFFSFALILFGIRPVIAYLPVIITIPLHIWTVFSPDIIAGTQMISYSVTRVAGDYYWVMQAFILVMCTSGLALLSYSALKSDKPVLRQKSTVILLSTAPLIIAAMTIVILMAIGFHINATVILSILTTITLGLLIYADSKYRLFKLLSYIPFTPEHSIRTKAVNVINQAMLDLFNDGRKVAFKDLRADFETALIELAIESTSGNKTRAAEILGIGKATLHRKIGSG